MTNITMALVELDPLLKNTHGKVGDLVSRRGRNGRTIVSRSPHKKKPKSRKTQKAVKERNVRQRQLMDDTHMYARIVMADPQKKADFQKKARRKKLSAYQLAFGHYFKTLKGEAK
jgi:hypothetical protein